MKLLMVLEDGDVKEAINMNNAFDTKPIETEAVYSDFAPFVSVDFKETNTHNELISAVNKYCVYKGYDLKNISMIPNTNNAMSARFLFVVEGWCREYDQQPDNTR